MNYPSYFYVVRTGPLRDGVGASSSWSGICCETGLMVGVLGLRL